MCIDTREHNISSGGKRPRARLYPSSSLPCQTVAAYQATELKLPCLLCPPVPYWTLGSCFKCLGDSLIMISAIRTCLSWSTFTSSLSVKLIASLTFHLLRKTVILVFYKALWKRETSLHVSRMITCGLPTPKELFATPVVEICKWSNVCHEASFVTI